MQMMLTRGCVKKRQGTILPFEPFANDIEQCSESVEMEIAILILQLAGGPG
jgi:hypothetical protein